MLTLCCILIADQDADARRAHRAKLRHAPAPVSEYLGKPNPPGPMRWADTRFEPLAWDQLDGWGADDHAAAFTAFAASCRAIVAGAKVSHDTRPVYSALVEICRKARSLAAADHNAARNFFEENFRPVRVGKIDDPNGFLTGYYEPVVDGSRTPTGDFKVPLYGRPRDLVHKRRRIETAFSRTEKTTV